MMNLVEDHERSVPWISSMGLTRPIFCTNRSESLHRSLGL